MLRIRNLFLVGFVGTAVALGCTSSSNAPAGGDGTVQVDGQKASALVAGRFEGSVSGDVRVWINDEQRALLVAPDLTFVVREVPSGNVTFMIDVAGVRGSITIPRVTAGEMIEVSVRVDSDTIVITITRRTSASEPPREVNDTNGGPLVIQANNVCYFLRPGVYTRDIIVRGNHVSLLGAASCTDGQRSVLEGTLRVEGNNDLVEDVELRGSVIVTGNHARIEDSCSRCFADGCLGGHGTCGDRCSGGPGSGGGGGGGQPGTDAGGGGTVEDAGTTFDAGGTFDAGTTMDAGGALDAGPMLDAGAD